MEHTHLHIYNTLSRKKEKFEPINPPFVGMYVCGPTLYNEPHIGNLRTFISFDMIYRYLKYLGYQVKYVRNITDAGHITNSLGEDVDNIGIAARLEQMQPLEIVYKYNLKFQLLTKTFNLLPPNIEPTASAHIQEQIEIIEKIIENGFGYAVNGSVYFDVKKYLEKYPYGILSGRNVDELEAETRALQGQEEKQFFADFGLWKRYDPNDMQIWRSPWGNGNPGWHIECTAMSTKYLGNYFDIHGGGMDLKAVHHENEIAQSCGALGVNPAKYWLHSNMLNLNGKKMSKSLGNFFMPFELIEGTSPLFSKPYEPSVIRFFMMMGHYRSELDISDEALQSAEKGYLRLVQSFRNIAKISPKNQNETLWNQLLQIEADCQKAMNDDFNTSVCIAHLFELASWINKSLHHEVEASEREIQKMQQIVTDYFETVLGIDYQEKNTIRFDLDSIMQMIIDIRKRARENKDYQTSDQIRDALTKAGIELKDSKEGTSYEII